MSEERITVDLTKYRAKSGNLVSKVFTGRDRAKSVLKESGLDNFLEAAPPEAKIKFIIPSEIYSINPSFFEELLYPLVTELGEDNFEKAVEFENLGSYNYKKPLDEAVSRILRKKTGLDY